MTPHHLVLRTPRVGDGGPRYTGVWITFAPTQSTIAAVRAVWKGHRELRSTITDPYGPSARIMWPGEVPAGETLVFDIWPEGEPLRAPRHQWHSVAKLWGDEVTGGPQLYEKIRRHRAGAAERDCEQAFLFELERNSQACLIRNPATTDPIDRRAEEDLVGLVNDAKRVLNYRVRARFEGGTPPRLPVTEEAAKIFHSAAAALGDRDLCKTLLRFANGQTRRSFWPDGEPLPGEPPGEPEVYGEPDSYFIFYFAELALAVRSLKRPAASGGDQALSPKFWQPLLPAMVAMQKIYMIRHRKTWPDAPGVTDYGMCNDWHLQPEEVEAIRVRYAAMSDECLEQVIGDHLRCMAPRFDYDGAPPP